MTDKRPRQEVFKDLVRWGEKLNRTGNKLSERETEAFHKIEREALQTGMKDRDIDHAIKMGRSPKPRYQDSFQSGAEVTRWI